MPNERRIADYVEWILDIERRFPVEQWVIEGVHIWPILRIRLNLNFFIVQSKAEPTETTTETIHNSKYTSFKDLLKNLWALLKFIARPIKNTPVIGADFLPLRAMFNNKMMDKYFDPIFDSFEGRYRGLIVEYERSEGVGLKEYYKPRRVIRLHEFSKLMQLVGLAAARFKHPNYRLEAYDEFLAILRKEGLDTVSYSKENIRRTVVTIKSTKWFWTKLFKKTKAKIAIGLCYYSVPLYAMILAARESGVVSVDLQHGGQGKDHLAYARFSKVPSELTYDLLPNYFWCWDDLSTNEIRKWIEKTNAGHKVVTVGHPWLDYLRGLKWPQLDNLQKIVMLTLQPPYGPESDHLLSDYIATTIKATAKEFKWFIRLHPRQLHQREALRRELTALGVLDQVDIDNATDLPLPAILNRASAHLTGSSGSAIEAALLGVPNVILDEVGASMFEDYVREGQAVLYIKRDPEELADIIRNAVEKKRRSASTSAQNSWEFIFQLR